ncbi:serine/threonine kinase PknH [Microdochium nivale]|nr:serine/threonine kinase PknH [Microdochium nivale]
MEVFHPPDGLQVDESRYPSPQHQHQQQQQQQQYPFLHGTSKSDLPASTYLGTPFPNTGYTSLPQVAPPPRKQRGWLLPALLGGLVAAVVVGCAVGGGLGTTLAKCQSQLSSPRPTDSQSPTNTSVPAIASSCPSLSVPLPTTSDGLLMDYDAPTAAEVYNIKVDCTALTSAAQVNIEFGDKYVVRCSVDYPGGSYTDGGGAKFRLEDIGALRAYSFQDCIDACSATSRTAYLRDMGVECKSVTFGLKMHGTNSNCWLKNGTLIDGQGKADKQYVSARLV